MDSRYPVAHSPALSGVPARAAACAALLGILLCTQAGAGLRGINPPPAGNEPRVTATSRAADQSERLYIVQLTGPSALAMHGAKRSRAQRSGLQASAAVERFDPNASDVQQHLRALKAEQEALLRSLNLTHNEIYSYRYSFNGIAVKMTPAQAEQLQLRRGVARVYEDRRRRVSTSDSPEFLGLLDSQTGLRSGLGLQGEDVIIAIIDSGITPGHPSVAERSASREKPNICRSEWGQNSLLGKWLCRRFSKPGPLLYADIPERWRGACETGENFREEDCNRKLIGARFYNAGFLADGPADVNEFASPADADGHGTHIASIAAGNFVDAEIFARQIGRISGMAPRARVAVYKACWLEPGGFRATCSVADLQAAIDDAVADGVDIINYSVGSLDDSLTDPDDLALLAAAAGDVGDPGILSVVATGNDGPEAFTMQAPATTPWVLSVGASSRTGNRVAEGIRVNKPTTLAQDYESREASFTRELTVTGPITGNLVLVDDGETVTPEQQPGSTVDACSELVNSSEVSGNIAYIQRGGCDFDSKINFAQDAGAIAVVVFNNDEDIKVMDGDATGVTIPAVMIGQADGQLLRDQLAAGDDVEVTLDKTIFINFAETGNIMGSFSGRGPSLADPDFLKPDVVAPGVRILGGQTPSVANGFRGELYQYLSGTSQSSPHVAGLAALIKEQHPDWTPAEIKSALMTTTRQNILKTAGGAAADPFDMGAGHVVPNSAVDPGLLYNVEIEEYDSYLCTIGLPRITQQQCAALVVQGLDLDAKDINLPSVAVTELVASAEITRRVRNVGPDALFRVEVVAPPSLNVTVTPAVLNLNNGDTAEFTVRFSPDGATLNQWLFGSFTWVSDNHRVHSPFAVQPTAFAYPTDVVAIGSTGSTNIDLEFGYDGDYAATVFGLERPCVLPDNTPGDSICTSGVPATVANDTEDFYQFTSLQDEPPASVERFFVEVDATDDYYFRVQLFDALTDGADDLDLYVWYCGDVCSDSSVVLVGSSVNAGTSNEIVERVLDDSGMPVQGIYVVDVHGFNTDTTAGDAGAAFCAFAWSFGSADPAGNLQLAGVPVFTQPGLTASVQASWQNLSDGLWLGGLNHYQDGGSTIIGTSLLEVDVNALPVQNAATFSCP